MRLPGARRDRAKPFGCRVGTWPAWACGMRQLVHTTGFALLLALTAGIGCSQSDSGPRGDSADETAADLAECNACNATMHECIANGDDLSSINNCVRAFADCAVERTGRSLVCH